MSKTSSESIAARNALRLVDAFHQCGTADYIGEPVSIIEHSLQAANQAATAGFDTETVLGALLHDVGHVLGLESGTEPGMEGCGTMDHEGVGAAFVEKLGFSSKVVTLVKKHVSAKRYLCYKYPDYYDKLTEASKTTLRYQGGVMDSIEAQAYEQDPLCYTYIKMREWDEKAKIPGLEVPGLETYIPLVEANIRATLGTSVDNMQHEYWLSSEQVNFFSDRHTLHIRNALRESEIASLSKWAEAIRAWPSAEGAHSQHWCIDSQPKVIAHVENFLQGHTGMAELCAGKVASIIEQLLDRPADLILGKDRLQFKNGTAPYFPECTDAHAVAIIAIDDIEMCVPSNVGGSSVKVALDPGHVLVVRHGESFPAIVSADCSQRSERQCAILLLYK
ncbi:hypothetical protein CYMTET_35080 [Cymbomonas tetramitiformis]|uniref:HD domain-containing protein n=1 Tax=Cymbomonas tetramitiformis TaxID=36881 RepID=A0AAE0F9S9_9CHLO|nr:hypothetical protein CYMTET_35080 [Cymbomonas tetramitiformis]